VESAAADAQAEMEAAESAAAARRLLAQAEDSWEIARGLERRDCDAMSDALNKVGLTSGEHERLKALSRDVAATGWDRNTVALRADAFAWAYGQRTAIQSLVDLVTERTKLDAEIATSASMAAHWRGRLEQLSRWETELNRRRARNAEIERKRTAASGFFAWLDTNVFTWKEDTSEIEANIRTIDRASTTEKLRQEETSNGTLRTQSASISSKIGLGLANLGKTAANSDDRDLVHSLHTDLQYATFLADRNGLALAASLAHVDMLARHEDALDAAKARVQKTSARYQQVKADSAAADVRSKELQQRNGPARLRNAAERIGIAQAYEPAFTSGCEGGSFRRACEQLISECRAAVERVKRFAMLRQALDGYHARLENSNLDLEEAVLAEANLVGATCTGIAASPHFQGEFDVVVIDECGRAMPLDLLIPMVRGKSVVLVGDHRQLPPTMDQDLEDLLRNRGLDDPALTQSLFEKLFTGIHPSRRESLDLQYRMRPEICDLVRSLSYTDIDLQPDGAALTRGHPFGGVKTPIFWIRCLGPKNKPKGDGGRSRSPYNEAEVLAIIAKLKEWSEHLRSVDAPCHVGVISMYRGQVAAIERAIAGAGLNDIPNLSLEIGTVDAFQGREKDAIIVSLVETDPNRRRFFYDVRRINVAISRSRSLLCLVGELESLGRRPTVPGDSRTANPLFTLHGLLRSGMINGSVTAEVFDAA
jgi:hypothetical protein